MDIQSYVSILVETAQQNWVCLAAALLIGIIVGWMSYPASKPRPKARR
jgi:hypothetical protein